MKKKGPISRHFQPTDSLSTLLMFINLGSDKATVFQQSLIGIWEFKIVYNLHFTKIKHAKITEPGENYM